MHSKLVTQLPLLGVLFLLASVVVAAFVVPLNLGSIWKYRSEIAFPMPMDVPDFCLRDQNGDLVCRERLLGHVWLADFIYLQCGDTCQLLTDQMITLQAKPGFQNVRCLSFSVDPREDSIGLKRYISRQPLADASRWCVLAADDFHFPKLAVAMGLAGSEGDIHDGYMPYSRCLFLIDTDGRVCGRYVGTLPDDIKRLEQDLSMLLRREEMAGANAPASVIFQSTQETP